mmetsp:Transcript_33140/g.46270  ORF Transcript_33140/g.46270 Transcript_33140/m.46270 type:complete len:103 (+) Transcript_33140:1495-1803(+)
MPSTKDAVQLLRNNCYCSSCEKSEVSLTKSESRCPCSIFGLENGIKCIKRTSGWKHIIITLKNICFSSQRGKSMLELGLQFFKVRIHGQITHLITIMTTSST